MTWRISGPVCECGKPLTPADTGHCARCTALARAVGQQLEPAETWDEFAAWLKRQEAA